MNGPPDYEVRLTKRAVEDIETLSPKLRAKLKQILTEVAAKTPHAGKRLVGDLAGNFSLRLTLKDRIVYSIDEDAKVVYVKQAKTHYGQ